MLEFQHRKIEFNRGFCAAALELVVEQGGNEFTTFLQQRFLFRLIFRGRQGVDRLGKRPDFGKGFDDGESGLGGLRAFSAREITPASGFNVAFAVGRLQILFPAEGILFVQARLIVYQRKWASFFSGWNLTSVMLGKSTFQIMRATSV